MKKTFLVDLNLDATDFHSIAAELRDTINAHFPYECTRVKPWAGKEDQQTLLPQPQQILPPTSS